MSASPGDFHCPPPSYPRGRTSTNQDAVRVSQHTADFYCTVARAGRDSIAVSRRSKPSSRTTFIGEQPNPWELLHPQDVMSRHRIKSMISHGADYIIILHRTLAVELHSLGWNCKSRRIALELIQSLSFRISRYRVIKQRVSKRNDSILNT